MTTIEYDVVIIGAGAAGLMCALTAGQRGKHVLVLDRSNKVGKKILMSGGGRCNFTNQFLSPDNFLSNNPHFCKSALTRYDQWQFIDLVNRHRIAFHEREHGQLFCDNSAKEILSMLLSECAQGSVNIRTHCEINNISTNHLNKSRYEISTNLGKFGANSIVVASGGLSIPKMGASAFGYQIARQFDLKVLPTRAGLVPLVFNEPLQSICERLSGISIDAELSAPYASATNRETTISFREALLFSHRGLSGPVTLQISNYWREGADLTIRLYLEGELIDLFEREKNKRPKALLRTILSEQLPRRLVTELENLLWVVDAEKPIGNWRTAQLTQLAETLSHWRLRPVGTQGYRTAEVTLGGVDTDEISSKTMESKRHPGLFFIGEVLDVTGHLGGFNFQWAWSSGHVAGSYA